MDTFINSFTAGMLGNQDPGTFVSNIVMSLLGIALINLIFIGTRDPLSPKTPVKFSWGYFFRKNLLKIITSVVLLYLSLRFTEELVGLPVGQWSAFLLGCINDQLGYLIQRAIITFRKQTGAKELKKRQI